MRILFFIVFLIFICGCTIKEDGGAKLSYLKFYTENGYALKLNELNNVSNEIDFNPDVFEGYELNINLQIKNIVIKSRPKDDFISQLVITGNDNIKHGESDIIIKVVSEDKKEEINYKIKLKKYSNETRIYSDKFQICNNSKAVKVRALQLKLDELKANLMAPDSAKYSGKFKILDTNMKELSENLFLYPEDIKIISIADNQIDSTEYKLEFSVSDSLKLDLKNHGMIYEDDKLSNLGKESLDIKIVSILTSELGVLLIIDNWENQIKFDCVKDYLISKNIFERRIVKGKQ